MARYEIKRQRVSRARETAAPYGVEQPAPADAPPVGFKVTVAERGRIVLPAEVRERLQIEDGDWLTLILDRPVREGDAARRKAHPAEPPPVR